MQIFKMIGLICKHLYIKVLKQMDKHKRLDWITNI